MGTQSHDLRIHWQKAAVMAAILLLVLLNVYQFYARGPSDLKAPAPPAPGSGPGGFVEHHSADVVDQFHEMFYKNPFTWQANQWFGILTQQNPNDVWMIQEILWDVKPDVIVETGSFHGGSAALWATILLQINPAGRVVTIDIEDQVTDAKSLSIVQESVDFLVGSSTAPKILEDVRRRVEGRRVLVILDSRHQYEHVLDELNAYTPMIDVGSYCIVQDTNVNGHPVLPNYGPGPMEAVEEFLSKNDSFQADRDRERLLFTMHPKGYLRRVKP